MVGFVCALLLSVAGGYENIHMFADIDVDVMSCEGMFRTIL